MSKVLLDATCENGIVRVGDLVITDVIIQSEGVGESSGILIIEDDERTYIAKTSGDLVITLEKLSDALGELSSALTAIDGKTQATVCLSGPGTTVATPVATATIAAIDAVQSEIDDLREVLK